MTLRNDLDGYKLLKSYLKVHILEKKNPVFYTIKAGLYLNLKFDFKIVVILGSIQSLNLSTFGEFLFCYFLQKIFIICMLECISK